MPSKFRQVLGLMVTPDFSEVESGRRPPPYVDHDQVDFDQLAAFLTDHFRCGETVRLRLPNDTVDQVTIFFRLTGELPGDRNLHDFSQALLDATHRARHPIPIREKWQKLHRLGDRKRAPPPTVIMFVVEGTFESVMLWTSRLGMRLGIRAADPFSTMMREQSAQDHKGQLTPALAQQLATSFGTPFLEPCALLRMSHSPIPAWATEG